MRKQYYLYGFCLAIAGYATIGTVKAQVPSNKPTTVTQVPATGAGFQVTTLPAAYPGTLNNYIRSRQAIAGITDEATFTNAGYTQVKQSTQYLDGLSRPLQTVSKQATPGSSPKDLVVPVVYDAFGREVNKYTSYVSPSTDGNFKLNPFSEQQTFMQNQYPGEQVFYSQTNFEASPLNRVQKTLAPGNSWGGSDRGTSAFYLTNTDADNVLMLIGGGIYLTGYPVFDTVNIFAPPTLAHYPPGALSKKITKDELDNAIVEYTDKSGNLILRKVQKDASIAADYSGYTGFICTYYLYDELNQLTDVIPPRSIAKLLSLNYWTFWSLYDECYVYGYDAKRRMTTKKDPDGSMIGICYDARDRAVLTSDAVPDRYIFTLYDNLNRPVTNGFCYYDLGSIQDYINQHSGDANNSGNRNGIVTNRGYFQDLDVYNRIEGVSVYQADNSITFEPPFTTETGAQFTAYINGTLGSTGGIVTVSENPLPTDGLYPISFTYYDDYSWTNKAFNNLFFGFLDDGGNANADPVATAPYSAKGMQTGSKRIVDNAEQLSIPNKWLTDIIYYDEKGRVIEHQQDNPMGGIDVTVNRYNFSGALITSYMVHANPQNNTNLGIKTNYLYDEAGRLLKVSKTIYNDAYNNTASYTTIISENEYDDLGQLKTKKFGRRKDDQGVYTSDPIAQSDYTYNIRGWLKSVNKDFANGVDNNLTSSTDRWFGMDLSYDWGYQNNQYNGNIAGIKWRSKGDAVQRSYGFGYDKLNRLLAADFSEGAGTTYTDNPLINFDAQMGDGVNASSAYDDMGNILAMKQWGIKGLTSTLIDDLQYIYGGNKLLDVTDNQNDPNSTLGDFKDISGPGSQKYGYDIYGRLVKDLHKGIKGIYSDGTSDGGYVTDDNGITYSHLSLPIHIPFVNLESSTPKGDIYFLYAVDTKIAKHVIDYGNTANGFQKKYTSTIYSGPFVYQSVGTTTDAYATSGQLQYMSTEEGRMRPVTLANGTSSYAFDYFLKDHLGNVRSVLTDEQTMDKYPVASLEPAKVATEKNYYNIDANNIVNTQQTSIPGLPTYTNGDNGIGNNPTDANFDGSQSNNLYKLNGNNNKTGLGITLKVMAGDNIDIFGRSYYFQNNTGGPGADLSIPVLEILNGLVGSPTGVITTNHIGITGNDLSGLPGTTSGISDLLNNQENGDQAGSPVPRAYINYLFFDEQFKCVGKGCSKVGNNQEFKQHHTQLQSIPAPKNGFVYIYCSNESPVDVFFDNLQVVQTHGPLLEETQYYPFGLTMAGISDKAVKANYAENKYKYNGKELQNKEFADASGLDWEDYGARMYDPQIGRWGVVDPKAEKDRKWSPYRYGYDNPIRFIDPDGMSEDDYYMDRDGNLLGVIRTNETVDRFYRVKDDGNTIENVRERPKGDNPDQMPNQANGRPNPEPYNRIPDVQKTQLVHNEINKSPGSNTDENGIVNGGKTAQAVQKERNSDAPNKIIGAFNTGTGIQLVRLNDKVDPGGATLQTILPANSLPAPQGVGSTAKLPQNAFAPNLKPTNNSNVTNVTDANGNPIPVWLQPQKKVAN